MTDDEIREILLPLVPLKDPYAFARAIAAAEREACAKVCESMLDPDIDTNTAYADQVAQGCVEQCVELIRARTIK